MDKKKLTLPPYPSTEVMVVVEDSPMDRLLVQRMLEAWGYHVLAGENGLEGLEILDMCKTHKLNLVGIMSDILMPQMDGMQFLQKVRRRSTLDNVPFVFLTGVSDNFYVADAEKYGADGYLLKPITAVNLKKKLEELFPGREFPQEPAA